MDYQYALRFETGERRGEVVPILVDAAAGGVFTVGRRPGNSLQVTDGSVSGKHAEILVDAAGVAIRDLGSTNGTLVGGQKVTEAGLQHLGRFSLGAVEFTLLDQAQGAPDPGGFGGEELMLEEPEELVLEEPTAAPMPTRRAAPAPARPGVKKNWHNKQLLKYAEGAAASSIVDDAGAIVEDDPGTTLATRQLSRLAAKGRRPLVKTIEKDL